MDELGDNLVRLSDLELTWGSDRDAVLRERAQQAPVAVDAGDRSAKTMGSSHEGAMGPSSVAAGMVDRDPGGT